MNNPGLSLAIAICGLILQGLICMYMVRNSERKRREALDALDIAKSKRDAAFTILAFSDEWRKCMTDDERTNLVIEWHERLKDANVAIELDDGPTERDH